MHPGVDRVMNWLLTGTSLPRCWKWNLFSYAWWNDPENDNEIDFNNDNFGGNYIFKWNNNEYSSFINNENDSDDDVRSNTNDYDNN